MRLEMFYKVRHSRHSIWVLAHCKSSLRWQKCTRDIFQAKCMCFCNN